TLTSKLTLFSQQAEAKEGYTLHTVTMSFKVGRITIPPNLVMTASGLCAPPTLSSTASREVSLAGSLPNSFVLSGNAHVRID
ncbi:hypothetical protein K435DRAFT_707110, partial [Dendrothele bispora CBS 962.96]